MIYEIGGKIRVLLIRILFNRKYYKEGLFFVYDNFFFSYINVEYIVFIRVENKVNVLYDKDFVIVLFQKKINIPSILARGIS